MAAIHCHTHILEFLLELELAQRNLVISAIRENALQYAARQLNTTLVSHYIGQGVDVNVRDSSGASPLLLAAGSKAGDPAKTIRFLI